MQATSPFSVKSLWHSTRQDATEAGGLQAWSKRLRGLGREDLRREGREGEGWVWEGKKWRGNSAAAKVEKQGFREQPNNFKSKDLNFSLLLLFEMVSNDDTR